MITALFRIIAYTFCGLCLEVIFSVTGIEKVSGVKLKKQTPHKYLEGFVSLYMIPVHGLGMYFGFEWLFEQIQELHFLIRYLIWCLLFTSAEIIYGFLQHKILGFYTWDYYKESKYKIFNEGYSLYTLIPLWGIAGMILEKFSNLLIYLSPFVEKFYN